MASIMSKSRAVMMPRRGFSGRLNFENRRRDIKRGTKSEIEYGRKCAEIYVRMADAVTRGYTYSDMSGQVLSSILAGAGPIDALLDASQKQARPSDEVTDGNENP